MYAFIGGSGFERFDEVEVLTTLERMTPFGLCSSGLKRVRIDRKEMLFLPRHGEQHELLPSEVNYRANVFALKAHGATAIISFSAVGSLRAQMAPGDLVVPLQYVDRTKSLREHTFCGDGVVAHMSLAHPVCRKMVDRLKNLLEGLAFQKHFGGTYLCIEGPNFSTLAESQYYRFLGADIIGMTNYPEYSLAREAGLPYLPCSFVTDYDCWNEEAPHVTLQQVMDVMKLNNTKAFTVLKRILSSKEPIYKGCDCMTSGLSQGLMTPLDLIPKEKREWVDVLLRIPMDIHNSP